MSYIIIYQGRVRLLSILISLWNMLQVRQEIVVELQLKVFRVFSYLMLNCFYVLWYQERKRVIISSRAIHLQKFGIYWVKFSLLEGMLWYGSINRFVVQSAKEPSHNSQLIILHSSIGRLYYAYSSWIKKTVA